MLDWINKRYRQGTSVVEKPFGGISIILVGSIAQFPLLIRDRDNVLHHKQFSCSIGTMGFSMCRQFYNIVKLTVNEISRGDNDVQINFRDALYRMKNGDSIEEDWKTLLSRTSRKVKNVKDKYSPLLQANNFNTRFDDSNL